MNTAIYYPYINVPKGEWTTKTLFYWDRMLSIVPTTFIQNPDKLDDYMLRLIELELVEQVFPQNYLNQVNNIDSTFIKYVENKYKEKSHTSTSYSPMYREKLNEKLYDELVKFGYAQKTNKNGIFLVDEKISTDYMFFLSNIISQFEKSMPVSDLFKNSSFYDKSQNFDNKKHAKVNSVILDQVLPTPKSVPIKELENLKKFKIDNEVNLRLFRKFIEKESLAISLEKDPKIRDEKLNKLVKKINEESLALEDSIQSSFGKNNLIFGNSLLVFGTVGLMTTFPNDLLSLISTLSIGLHAVNSSNKVSNLENKINNKPLAYIAHAKRYTKRN